MSKKQRNTPNNYSGNFFLETGTRKHEKDINPFGKVKMNNGKKDINFTMFFEDVYVSSWWEGTYDKFDSRSILVIWKEDNPTTPDVVKWYEKFTEDANTAIGSAEMKRHFRYPDGYKVANPLRYDADKKEYRTYCNINLKNLPDEDYGKFIVELINKKEVPLSKLKNHGFFGSIIDMAFELKGKVKEVKGKPNETTLHIAQKLFKAVAVKFVETKFDDTEDVRNRLVEKHGMDTLAEAEKILEGADDDDTDTNTSINKKIVAREDSSSEDKSEEKKPKQKLKLLKSSKEDEEKEKEKEPVKESSGKKKKKKQPEITDFDPSKELGGDE